jgi:hypothetical protein
MQIKQGTNVDANGKVDLPYLRDWRYVSQIKNSQLYSKGAVTTTSAINAYHR